MRLNRKTCKTLLSALALSLSFQAQATTPKTGYVSMGRLIQTSTEGKQALADLQQVISQKQADLAEQRKGIEGMFREWEEKQALLSEEAKKSEERAFQEKVQRKAMEMKQAEMMISEEVQQRQREIAEKMRQKLESMLALTEQGRNLDFVIDPDTGAILYAKNASSLTDAMIDQYNKNFKLAQTKGK
ncbi:MAG: OmpH family outer membrane protein [Oligoflexales bacterium]